MNEHDVRGNDFLWYQPVIEDGIEHKNEVQMVLLS